MVAADAWTAPSGETHRRSSSELDGPKTAGTVSSRVRILALRDVVPVHPQIQGEVVSLPGGMRA
jgi:hypothetical protein